MALAKFLYRAFGSESFSVEIVHSGESAAEALKSACFDLVLLDLNQPSMDSITLLKQLRPVMPMLPILVLTARTRVEDRVMTLEQGADDCLVKPFSFLELQARVRALLRRNRISAATKLTVGDLTLHPEQHRVERNGRRIDLTPREFSMLEHLMRHARHPVGRATLMQEVWNVPYDPSTNIVDVYMKYVRDKVDLAGEKKLIRTIRGVGYVLSDE